MFAPLRIRVPVPDFPSVLLFPEIIPLSVKAFVPLVVITVPPAGKAIAPLRVSALVPPKTNAAPGVIAPVLFTTIAPPLVLSTLAVALLKVKVPVVANAPTLLRLAIEVAPDKVSPLVVLEPEKVAVPPLTVVAPVKVLLPEKVAVPADTVNPPEPLPITPVTFKVPAPDFDKRKVEFVTAPSVKVLPLTARGAAAVKVVVPDVVNELVPVKVKPEPKLRLFVKVTVEPKVLFIVGVPLTVNVPEPNAELLLIFKVPPDKVTPLVVLEPESVSTPAEVLVAPV